MEHITKYFDRIITYTLLIIACIFILVLTMELVVETVQVLSLRLHSMGMAGNPETRKNVFILFFNVLLMMEVLETIKVFNKAHVVKIRIILLVCLIAVSRKIFIMDVEGANAAYEFALAALIIAISLGYFLISRSDYFDRLYSNNSESTQP